MADATFSDVLEETKRTNEILRQNAKEAQKPDPLRHIKEEAITMVIERKRFRQSIALDKKRTEAADVADKQRDKQSSQDSKYYKQQVEEQGATTSSQEDTEKGVRKGSIERFDQNFDLIDAQQKTSDILQKQLAIAKKGPVQAMQLAKKSDAQSKLEKTTTKNTFDRFKDTLDKINKKLTPYAKFGKKLFELTGIGALGKKIKGGAGSVFGFLKSGIGKLIGGGLIIGMLTFFNSKMFQDIVKWFEKDGLKVIADFYDNVFLPVFKNGIKFVVDLFRGVKEFFASPRFDKARKLFKDGKIFSAIGEGLDALINAAGEQFGIKDLAGKIRTGFEAVYNSLAATLNGVISTIEFFGADVGFRLPKLIDGKFVDAQAAAAAADSARVKTATERVRGRRGRRAGPQTAEQKKLQENFLADVVDFLLPEALQRAAGIKTKVQREADADELRRIIERSVDGPDPDKVRSITREFERAASARRESDRLIERRRKFLDLQERGITITGNRRARLNVADELEKTTKALEAAQERARIALTNLNNITQIAPTTNVPQVIGEGSPYMGPASSTVDLLTGVGGIRL